MKQNATVTIELNAHVLVPESYNALCNTNQFSGASVYISFVYTNNKPSVVTFLLSCDCVLFVCVHVQHYGYTKLAANATTLVFEFIRNEDNEVYDMLILEKFY